MFKNSSNQVGETAKAVEASGRKEEEEEVHLV